MLRAASIGMKLGEQFGKHQLPKQNKMVITAMTLHHDITFENVDHEHVSSTRWRLSTLDDDIRYPK